MTTLTEVLPCFFLSCKANASVKLAKTGHGQHSSKLFVICVVLLLFVLFSVLFVCKCVLYYGHRVATQLQLTNTYININIVVSVCDAKIRLKYFYVHVVHFDQLMLINYLFIY